MSRVGQIIRRCEVEYGEAFEFVGESPFSRRGPFVQVERADHKPELPEGWIGLYDYSWANAQDYPVRIIPHFNDKNYGNPNERVGQVILRKDLRPNECYRMVDYPNFHGNSLKHHIWNRPSRTGIIPDKFFKLKSPSGGHWLYHWAGTSMDPQEQLERVIIVEHWDIPVKDPEYPHFCTRCGQPCYQGAWEVDHKNKDTLCGARRK